MDANNSTLERSRGGGLRAERAEILCARSGDIQEWRIVRRPVGRESGNNMCKVTGGRTESGVFRGMWAKRAEIMCARSGGDTQ